MTEQEAVAYIEEWDVIEAAKVLKWYENDELLRPCDCDTIVAIETEDLRAENTKLLELVDLLLWGIDNDVPPADGLVWSQKVNVLTRELGIKVEE